MMYIPHTVLMLSLSLLQVIFRKIADVKRERERQRTEVTLSIPEDHPVRKLFQRFRQQRDSQAPGESHSYFDHNCVQLEPQHHHQQPTDPKPYTQSQAASRQQKEYSSSVLNNAPSMGGGSTGSSCNMAAAPQAFVSAEKPEQSSTQEVAAPRPCAESQQCERGNIPAQSSGAGGDGAAGDVSRGTRGWAKFRNAASPVLPCPAVEQEKQTQKVDGWLKVSRPSEQFAAANRIQESEEGGEGTEGGNTAGEETSALHKTDSCDSGITKSDLRIDRAGDSRSSFERSPMEKSPMERNLFEHSIGVYSEASVKHSFTQPASEQALLQAMLHEAKLELKGDIQMLSGRLSLLESHVGEILRLLSIKRRLSLPPTSSAKARVRNQDPTTASRPGTPKTDEGPF